MILLLALLLAMPQAAGQAQGVVTDQSGSTIAGATVVIAAGAARRETTSGPDGRFPAPAATPEAPVEIAVRAPGFAEARQTFDGAGPLVVVLRPAPVTETVTVAATRSEQRSGDVPASVTLLSSRDIRSAAALTVDDLLRQVPSFSLFRRTSSLVSHPTTQGVSLRGIGPSGVSRTLVLVDGVPANDAFGGWVYWSRVPLEQAERIELAEGPASSLYGNYAMGGVINIVTATPAPKVLTARAQYGSEHTSMADVAAGSAWRRAGVLASVTALDTSGYAPVAESERGPVDTNAALSYVNATLKLAYDPRDSVHLFARGSYFHEERDNGKVAGGTPEANATFWRSASGGARLRPADGGEIEVTASANSETFHSNFLAVPASTPPRSVARVTLNQEVPADDTSLTGRWARTFGAHFVTAGADWRRVTGDSVEDALDPVTGARVTLHRVSGGRQQNAGLYVQDMYAPGGTLVITAGARVDGWRTYDGHNLETALPSGEPTAANAPSLPARSATVASPRLAALVRVHPGVQVWGGAGGGFRAPTLNELYRQFRVGSTLTLPNADLEPEHLAGYEAGVTTTPSSRATIRATLFDNRLRGPISNVTISSASPAVVQQRQNLGRTRAYGVEADAEYRVQGRWTLAASYIHTRSIVTGNPANPDLVGNVLPQVPSQRGSLRASWVHPRGVSISLSAVLVGAQFDDDRNTPERRLAAYGVMDANMTGRPRRGVELFAAVQNLFNHTYATGTLPTTIGLPRLVSAGVRLRVGGR